MTSLNLVAIISGFAAVMAWMFTSYWREDQPKTDHRDATYTDVYVTRRRTQYKALTHKGTP